MGFHETMMRRVGAPTIMQSLGETDGDGQPKQIVYRPRGLDDTAPDVNFAWPYLMSDWTFQDHFENGQLSRKETASVRVTRELVAASGVLGFQASATIEVDGEVCSLVESLTKFGPTFVIFGVAKTPLVARNDRRG